MNEILYIRLFRTDNNELWIFKETQRGFVKHRRLKEIIEGNNLIIENDYKAVEVIS